MAKIYIATTLSKKHDHNYLRDILLKKDHEITYDWTSHPSLHDPHFNYDTKEAVQVARSEKDGVVDADILVVLLPGKKGTHVEIGMALASGIPIIIHSEEKKDFDLDSQRCVFYFHPNVTQVHSPLKEPDVLIEKIEEKLLLNQPVLS